MRQTWPPMPNRAPIDVDSFARFYGAVAGGEPTDRASRRPGHAETQPPTTRPDAREDKEEATTERVQAQPLPGPTKSEIAEILKRFGAPPAPPRPSADDPDLATLPDPPHEAHDPIAFDETLELKRGPARAPDERIGTVIAGRYRLRRVIGEGGMGTVFEAAHIGLEKRVAIKILSGLSAGHDQASERFLREARASSAVDSEHCVHVFDVGEDLQVGLYMVMELLKGKDLAEVLLKRGRLRAEAAAGVAWQVSLALERAHQAGIVHRDLKPANVFLSRSDDGSIRVRVLDFGIAKLVRDAKEVREGITQRGMIVGTPQYMSPEQAQGLPTVDARADFYSLGALLFECLTGTAPYPHLGTYEQTILKIMMEPPPRASSLVPDVEPAIDQLIAELMARAPEARPSSLEGGRARLAHVHPSLPLQRLVLGPPPDGVDSPRTGSGLAVESRPRTMPRAPSRIRWPVVGAALGLVAVIVVLWISARRLGGGERGGLPEKAGATPATQGEALTIDAERLEREGRGDLACARYEKASDADPTAARAALRASLCYFRKPQLGRAYYRRAWANRASLNERDAGLVDALEARFQRDPVDNGEWLERIDRLSKKFPEDAELHVLLHRGLKDADQLAAAVAELKRALEIDPKDLKALEFDADTQAYSGDFATARRDLEQCLGVARGALGCIEERAWIDGEEGKCAAVEAGGRRMLSVEPTYAEGFSFVANALFAEGSPLTAIRVLLRRRRELLPLREREGAEHADELQLAMLGGDLGTAEKLARTAYDALRGDPSAPDHGRAARTLVAILDEMGRPGDASSIAGEYLGGRDAWEPSPRLDDWALADEPTPRMLATRLHAGDLSLVAFERERGKTLQRYESRVVPQVRNFIWIYGYAAPTETAAEAKVAIDRLPAYLPLPPYTPLALAAADVGRAFFLAGRVDEAIPLLERATANCFPLDHPIEQTRAYYVLGQAREAEGDRTGACAAYAVVRDRWGVAKGRPATAQKALSRRAVLGCGE
jgi:tetratricopeptide (TPR) repeat protein